MSDELNGLLHVIKQYFTKEASSQIDALNVKVASLQHALKQGKDNHTELLLAADLHDTTERLTCAENRIELLKNENTILTERNGKLSSIQGGKDMQLSCYLKHLTPTQRAAADKEWREMQSKNKKCKAAAISQEQAAAATFTAPDRPFIKPTNMPCTKQPVMPDARPISASHVSGPGGLLLEAREMREWDHS